MSKLDLILESGSRKGIWPSSVTGWSSKPKMGRCKSLIVGTDDGSLLIKRLNLKPVEGRDGVWEAVSGSDTIMEVQQMDWLHHAEIRIFFGYLTIQGVTDLVDLIRTTIYGAKPPVMVMRQEEAKASDALALKAKFPEWDISVIGFYTRRFPQSRLEAVVKDYGLVQNGSTDWYNSPNSNFVVRFGSRPFPTFAIAVKAPRIATEMAKFEQGYSIGRTAMVMRQEEGISNGPLSLLNDEKKELENKFKDWKFSLTMGSRVVTEKVFNNLKKPLFLKEEKGTDFWYSAKYKVGVEYDGAQHLAALSIQTNVFSDFHKYKAAFEILDKAIASAGSVMVMRQEEAMKFNDWKDQPLDPSSSRYSCYVTDSDKRRIVREFGLVSEGPWVFSDVHDFTKQKIKMMCLDGTHSADSRWHVACDINYKMKIEKLLKVKPPAMVMRQEEASVNRPEPAWAYRFPKWRYDITKETFVRKLPPGSRIQQVVGHFGMKAEGVAWVAPMLRGVMLFWKGGDNDTAIISLDYNTYIQKNMTTIDTLLEKPPVMVMRQEEAAAMVWPYGWAVSKGKVKAASKYLTQAEAKAIVKQLNMEPVVVFCEETKVWTKYEGRVEVDMSWSKGPTDHLSTIYVKLRGLSPSDLNKLIADIEKAITIKPPVMVMRQEEARSPVAQLEAVMGLFPKWVQSRLSGAKHTYLRNVPENVEVSWVIQKLRMTASLTGGNEFTHHYHIPTTLLAKCFLLAASSNTKMLQIELGKFKGTPDQLKHFLGVIEREAFSKPPVMVMRQEEANYNTWLDSLKLEWRHDWPTNTIFTIISGSKIGDLIKKLKLKKDKTPWCDWSEEQEVIEVYWSGSINPAKVAVRTDVPAATEQVIKDTVEKIDRLASKQPVMVMRQEEASSRFDKILEINLEKVVQTWMKSPENAEWEGAPAYCRRKVSTGGQGLLIKHFDMLKVQGHGGVDTYFTTEDEPEAISMDRETIVVFYNKWKGSLKNFVDFLKTVNRLLSTKPPVMVMRQEEAKAASPILWSKFDQFYTGRLKPEFKGLWRAINRNWNLKLDPDSKKVPNYSNKGVDFLYTTDVCDLYSDYFINVTGQEARKKVEAFAKQFMEAGGKLPAMVMRQEEAVNTALTGATSDLAQLRKVFKKWPSWKHSEVRSVKNTFYMILDPKADTYRIVNELGLSLESGSGTPLYFAATTGILYNCFNLVTGRRNGAPPRMEFYLSSFSGTPEQLKNILVAIDHSLVKPPAMVMRQEESRLNTVLNEVGWAKAKAFATANGWWIGGRTLGLRINAKQADDIIRQFKMQAVAGGLTWKFEGITVTKRETEGYDKLDVLIHNYSAGELYQVVTKIDQIVKSVKPPVMVMRQEEAKISSSDIAMLKDAYPDWTFSTTAPGRTINRAWIVVGKPAAEAVRRWVGPTYHQGDVVTVDDKQDPIIVSVHGKYASTVDLFRKFLFTTDSIIKKVKPVKPPVMVMRQEEASVNEMKLKWTKFELAGSTFYTCTLISEIAAQKMIADKKMKLEPAGVDRWWNTDYITTQLLLTKNKAGKNSFPSYEVTVNGMDWRNAVEKAAGPRQSSQEETIKIA